MKCKNCGKPIEKGGSAVLPNYLYRHIKTGYRSVRCLTVVGVATPFNFNDYICGLE